MAGARQPAPWGLEPIQESIDDGTSCRVRTPAPGPIGLYDGWTSPAQASRRGAETFLVDRASESVHDLKTAVADFRRSERWSTLQPIVFGLVGQYSFGLGVLYGIGESIIGSVVELGQLAKTFLLADLYDRAHQPGIAAAFGPVAALQRLLADVSMRAFASELEAAHTERDELIGELRYAMTHLGEVVGNIAGSYVSKWNRFEVLSKERTLSSQFEAGRIFGEVLLEVVSLIGGGAAAVKAASKIPRLARLARLKIPARSRPQVSRGAGAPAAGERPVMTPSQARTIEAPAVEPPPPKPPPPKSFAAELAGSQFNGIKAERIRPGSDTKVAVIGRNMEQVDKYAQGLKEQGIQPEVFAGDKISFEAQKEWDKLRGKYAPRIPDSEVRNSLMFRENEAWVQKLADQGYTVFDIGNTTRQGLSPFYEMEKGILFPAK